jgi:hypothetical protein
MARQDHPERVGSMFEFLLVGRPYKGFPANIIARTAFDAGLFSPISVCRKPRLRREATNLPNRFHFNPEILTLPVQGCQNKETPPPAPTRAGFHRGRSSPALQRSS